MAKYFCRKSSRDNVPEAPENSTNLMQLKRFYFKFLIEKLKRLH